MTLIDDVNGDLSALAVYNLDGDANHLLYNGRKIAVIEPFYKLRADGTPGIRVDNPDEIFYDVEGPGAASCPPTESTYAETIPNDQGDKNNNSSESASAPYLPLRRPEMHRIVICKKVIPYRHEGNVAFTTQKYKDAERLHRAAIDAIKPDALAKGSESGAEKKGIFALWILYANRAICRIKLGTLDLALKDAIFSHVCAPAETSKPLLRCAQALASLGRRIEAIAILQETLTDAVFTDTTPIKALKKATRIDTDFLRWA